jgi:hypothetical protein
MLGTGIPPLLSGEANALLDANAADNAGMRWVALVLALVVQYVGNHLCFTNGNSGQSHVKKLR